MYYSTTFFFSILWCNHTSDHAQEELARFGYRSERKVENVKNLAIFWQPAGTNISSLRSCALAHFFHKNPFYESLDLLLLSSGKNSPWKKCSTLLLDIILTDCHLHSVHFVPFKGVVILAKWVNIAPNHPTNQPPKSSLWCEIPLDTTRGPSDSWSQYVLWKDSDHTKCLRLTLRFNPEV
jgi:hypothetical protein